MGDRCTVEWDGDDESYTGVITEVERRRVKVKYDEGGEELWEDRERLLDPHNQYAWLSAELQPQGDDGWLLKYEDGEQHSRGSGGAAGCRFSILYGCHACPRNGGLPTLLRRGGV